MIYYDLWFVKSRWFSQVWFQHFGIWKTLFHLAKVWHKHSQVGKSQKEPKLYHLLKSWLTFLCVKTSMMFARVLGRNVCREKTLSFTSHSGSSSAIPTCSPAIPVSSAIILTRDRWSINAKWQLDVWRGNTKQLNCSSLRVISTNMLCFQMKKTTS